MGREYNGKLQSSDDRTHGLRYPPGAQANSPFPDSRKNTGLFRNRSKTEINSRHRNFARVADPGCRIVDWNRAIPASGVPGMVFQGVTFITRRRCLVARMYVLMKSRRSGYFSGGMRLCANVTRLRRGENVAAHRIFDRNFAKF